MTRSPNSWYQIDANTGVKAAIGFNTRVQIEQMQVMNEAAARAVSPGRCHRRAGAVRDP